jgi:hypothetical protein
LHCHLAADNEFRVPPASAVIDSQQPAGPVPVEPASSTVVVECSVLRAIVSKRVIDRLIREKLRQVPLCNEVSALPVVWRRPLGAECNWEIPGWTGEARAITTCSQQIAAFVHSLESQFDIADEEPSATG